MRTQRRSATPRRAGRLVRTDGAGAVLRLLCAAILAMLPVVALPSAAAAAPRAALVVAEAAYPDSDAALTTPVADGAALAEELKRRGFAVTVAENASREALRAAIDAFARAVEPDGVALVYFGGYGIQVGRKNYLIPVDARIWSEADVIRDGISVDALLDDLARRQAGIRALILDAARRNPFERRFRSFSQGLAPAAAPPGSIILSTAAPGGVVSDGAGPRSPFVAELIQQIGAGESVDRAFAATLDAVAKRSRNAQVPAVVADLGETFFFDPDRPRAPVAKPTPMPAPAAPPPAAKPEEARAPVPEKPSPAPERREEVAARQAEEAAARDYDAARRKGTVPAYREFLDRYPSGQRADAARAEIVRIEAEARQAAAAFDAAEASNTAAAYGAFLDRHPTGPLAEKAVAARARLAAAEERRADQERRRLSELDERIRRNPRDEVAYYERGQFHAQRNAAAAAIADFDQAIRLNPASPEAYNNRCWMRAVADDLKRALADCNEALRLRPGFLDALDSRGLVNLKAGAFRAAVADYSEVLRLDARHSAALYGRGLALKRLGEDAPASRDMAGALELNPQIDKDFATYGIR